MAKLMFGCVIIIQTITLRMAWLRSFIYLTSTLFHYFAINFFKKNPQF